MSFKRVSFILIASLSLSACSYFSQAHVNSRDKNYLNAKSIAPLRIPPGLNSNKFHNQYPVSDKTYPPSAYNISLEPPGLSQ